MAEATPCLGLFERYLTACAALCMIAGIALGHAFPAAFTLLGAEKVASTNLAVALLIWLMIVPMLLKVDFGSIRQGGQHWRGIGVTLFINWTVKPFSMALLGWFFLKHVFVGWLPPDQVVSYMAGLILLASAPCTAMVFVWSHLCRGNADFTLRQVALNDAIMMVAFAPLVRLLLGLSSITVPWASLALSVGLFILVPVAVAVFLRRWLLVHGGRPRLDAVLARLSPLSLTALLAMLVLLFGFQGQQIIGQPLVISVLALPILIQVYFNSGLAYLLNRRLGVGHDVAGPSALIGASNFFELAVATAVGLFGTRSGAALATVAGALVEVPVMLSVVAIVNASRAWYSKAGGPALEGR